MRYLTAAIVLALPVTLLSSTNASAQSRCVVERPARHGSRTLRTRALIASMLPTLYVDLSRRRRRVLDRQLGLAPAPPSTAPRPRRLAAGALRSIRWEVGLVWEPLAFARRLEDVEHVTDQPRPAGGLDVARCRALDRRTTQRSDSPFRDELERELLEREIDAQLLP